MPEDADGGLSDADSPWPSAADFNAGFEAAARSPGLRQVWRAAEPDLPVEVEPFSFVSVGLLGHVAHALALIPGQTLVDLGCGRGGPGLWLARSRGASLIGVDFSPVAIQQASDRAALFGLATSRWRPEPSGTGCSPGSIASRSILEPPARTARWPRCRTRRISACRSPSSLTG
jgi:hypothetical protein